MRQWGGEQFVCWLAGFFDGEGCIYLNPKAVRSCEVSIANTDYSVIQEIKRRLGVGVLTEITFSNPKWKSQLSWRVRNYRDVLTVLELIRPFLTIKAVKADEALRRVRTVAAQRQARRERNEKVHLMIKTGLGDAEIANRVGVSRALIWQIRNGLQVTDCPQRDSSHIRTYTSNVHSKHTAPFGKTKAKTYPK